MKRLILLLFLIFTVALVDAQMIINPYRFSISYDTDAQAFFDAAGITDVTQKQAVNDFVVAYKANGFWTDSKAIYRFSDSSSSIVFARSGLRTSRPAHSRPKTSVAPGGGGYRPLRCRVSALLTPA